MLPLIVKGEVEKDRIGSVVIVTGEKNPRHFGEGNFEMDPFASSSFRDFKEKLVSLNPHPALPSRPFCRKPSIIVNTTGFGCHHDENIARGFLFSNREAIPHSSEAVSQWNFGGEKQSGHKALERGSFRCGKPSLPQKRTSSCSWKPCVKQFKVSALPSPARRGFAQAGLKLLRLTIHPFWQRKQLLVNWNGVFQVRRETERSEFLFIGNDGGLCVP